MDFVRVTHSFLYLLSRLLLLLHFLLPQTWNLFHLTLRTILFVLCLQQAFHVMLRLLLHNESNIYYRHQTNRIKFSNGIFGKLLAAVLAYWINIRDEPAPINLLHWLDIALQHALFTEGFKMLGASRGTLRYTWNSHRFVLLVEMDDIGAYQKQITQLRKWITGQLLRILHPAEGTMSYFVISIWDTAPSNIVWLVMLTQPRETYACLARDARERALSQHSNLIFKQRKWNRINNQPNTNAIMFGVDMTANFRCGTSRAISVADEADIATFLDQVYDTPESAAARIGELIDQDAVFVLSYRHLRDQRKEKLAIGLALQVARLMANKREKTTFRVWCDKLLRASPHRSLDRWAEHGLLMYAFYVVIAVRQLSEDETSRMWLLAEERLGYGSEGLVKVAYEDGEIKWLRTQSIGPENSIRVYFRFLVTGEAMDERTFHEEDRRNFQRLAEAFGMIDDEMEMLNGLRFLTVARPRYLLSDNLWWRQVINTESYAGLRPRAYERQHTYDAGSCGRFDGYKEWFREVKDEPFLQYISNNKLDKIPPMEIWQLGNDMGIKAIILIYRNNSGILERTAVMLIKVVDRNGIFLVLDTNRMKIQYEEPPPSEDIVDAVLSAEFPEGYHANQSRSPYVTLIAAPCSCDMEVYNTSMQTLVCRRNEDGEHTGQRLNRIPFSSSNTAETCGHFCHRITKQVPNRNVVGSFM